jgi:hypothetical protein
MRIRDTIISADGISDLFFNSKLKNYNLFMDYGPSSGFSCVSSAVKADAVTFCVQAFGKHEGLPSVNPESLTQDFMERL